MKSISVLLFFLFALNVTFAQSGKDDVVITTSGKTINKSVLSGAEFEFNTEIHDFGEVFDGQKVTVTFSFTNIGDQILNLYKVEAGCESCMEIVYTKETLQPGDGGTIKVTYDTTNRLGEFNKSMQILSDAKQPNKVIRIKGYVKQDFFGEVE